MPRRSHPVRGSATVIGSTPGAVPVARVEQNVRAAVDIADRAYVLDDGRMVYEGRAAALARDENLVRSLAGASAEKWDVVA